MSTSPSATDRLFRAMLAGRSWPLPPAPDGRDTERDGVRQLIREVFAERYHEREWERFQARNALGPAAASQESDTAAYAGVITAENPASGPYQGTSFVWFPADAAEKPATTGAAPNGPTTNPGSVAVLVIGTGGFGADAHILGRPGHRRRLLSSLARREPVVFA